MKYTFHINRAPCFRDSYELYFIRWPDLGGALPKQVLSMNGWLDCPEGSGIVPILIEAQDLIPLAGELWKSEIKPPEFFNSVGQQDATEKHLSDMRAIVFSKLNIRLPEAK